MQSQQQALHNCRTALAVAALLAAWLAPAAAQDVTAPVLLSFTTDAVAYKAGATMTFTIEYTEASGSLDDPPTVTVMGNAPTTLTVTGTQVSGTYDFVGDEGDGPVAFSCVAQDLDSNVAAEVTTTTPAGDHPILDTVAPVIASAVATPNQYVSDVSALGYTTMSITLTYTDAGSGAIQSAPPPAAAIFADTPDSVVVTDLRVVVSYEVSAGTNAGSVGFNVIARDLAGNAASPQTSLTSGVAVLDRTAPVLDTLVSDVTVGFPGETITLTASFTDTTPMDDAAVVTISSEAATTVEGSGLDVIATLNVTAGSVNGPAVISFAAFDGAGNAATVASALTSGTLDLDTTGPTLVSATADSMWYKAGDTITLVVTYTDTYAAGIEDTSPAPVVTINGGAATMVGVVGFVVTITKAVTGGSDEGPLQFSVDVSDTNQNAAATITQADLSAPATVDVSAPTLDSFTVDKEFYTQGDTLVATLVFLDPIAGQLDAGSASGSVHTATDADSLSVDTLTLTAQHTFVGGEDEGAMTFAFNVTDPAGNEATTVTAVTDGSTPTYDETAPLLSTAVADAEWYRPGTTITVVFTFTEANPALADGASTDVQFDGNSAASAVVDVDAKTVTATYTFGSSETEGDIALICAVADLAGNVASAASFFVTSGNAQFDRTAPVLSTASMDQEYYGPGHTITLTLVFTDTPSGAIEDTPAPTVTIVGEAADSVVVVGLTVTITKAVTGGTTEGLPAFVAVGVTDIAGNAVAGGDITAADLTSGSPLVDVTAPALSTATSTLAYAQAGDTVQIELVYTDLTGDIRGPPVVPVLSTLGRAPDSEAFTALGVTVTTILRLSDAEGVLPWSVQVTDLTGVNQQTTTALTTGSGDIIIDNTPPTLVSSVATGADDLYLRDGDLVTITLTYTDANGGLDASASAATVMSNPVDSLTVVGLQLQLTYTIQGADAEGALEMSVIGADLALNEAPAVTFFTGGKTVLIDHTPPTVVAATADASFGRDGETVRITIEYADAGAAAILDSPLPTATVNGGGAGVTVSVSGLFVYIDYEVQGGAAEAAITFACTASDLAGNQASEVNAFTSGSFIIDRSPPVLVSAVADATHYAVSDTMTLTLTFTDVRTAVQSAPLPVVTVMTRAPATVNVAALVVTITYVFIPTDNEGDIEFSVDVEDLTGNPLTVTEADLSGSAWLDKSPPTLVSAVSDTTWAKEGDVVTLTLTYSDSAGGVGVLESSPPPVVSFMDGQVADSIGVAGMVVTLVYTVAAFGVDAEGDLVFSCTVRDDLGTYANVGVTTSALTSGSTTLDLTPPTLVSATTDAGHYAVGDTITLTLQYADAWRTGLDATNTVTFFGNAAASVVITDLAVVATYTFGALDGEGDVVFDVAVRDETLNDAVSATALTTGSAWLDKSPPTLVSATSDVEWARVGDFVTLTLVYSESAGGVGALQETPLPAVTFNGFAPDSVTVEAPLTVTVLYRVRAQSDHPSGPLLFSVTVFDDLGVNANAAVPVTALTAGSCTVDSRAPEISTAVANDDWVKAGDVLTLSLLYTDSTGVGQIQTTPVAPVVTVMGKAPDDVIVGTLDVQVLYTIQEADASGALEFSVVVQDIMDAGTGNTALEVSALTSGTTTLDMELPVQVATTTDREYYGCGHTVTFTVEASDLVEVSGSRATASVIGQPADTISLSDGLASTGTVTFAFQAGDGDNGAKEGPLEFDIVLPDLADNLLHITTLTESIAVLDCTTPERHASWASQDFYRMGQTIAITVTFERPEQILTEAPFAPTATVFGLPAIVTVQQDPVEWESQVTITRLVDTPINDLITGNFELTIYDLAENPLVVTTLTDTLLAEVDSSSPGIVSVTSDDIHYKEGDVLHLELMFDEDLHQALPSPFAMIMKSIVSLEHTATNIMSIDYTFSGVDAEGPITIAVTVSDLALNPTTLVDFTSGAAFFDRTPAVASFSLTRTHDVEPHFNVSFNEEVRPIDISAVSVSGAGVVLTEWTRLSEPGPLRGYPGDSPSLYRIGVGAVEDHFTVTIAGGTIIDLADNVVDADVTHVVDFAAVRATVVSNPLVVREGEPDDSAFGTGVSELQIVLTTAPLEDVTVAPVQHAPLLVPTGQLQLELSPAEVVFHPWDWFQPQTIEVRATNDLVDEWEPMRIDVTFFAESDDSVYDLVDYAIGSRVVHPANVSTDILDNDVASVFLTNLVPSGSPAWQFRASAVVPEGAVQELVGVQLATMPMGTVVVTLEPPFVAVSEPQAPGAELEPLTGFAFDWTTWDVRQGVNVTVAQDVIDFGADWNISVAATTVSSDAEEAYHMLASETYVTADDDDSVGVLASVRAVTLLERPSLPTVAVDFELATKPLSPVTLALSIQRDEGPIDAAVSVDQLVFPPELWDKPQKVLLHAFNDNIEDLILTRSSRLVYATDGGSEPGDDELYYALEPNATAISVIEDDRAAVVMSSEFVQVTEGPNPPAVSRPLGVRLASQPTAPVDVLLYFDASQIWVQPQNLTMAPLDYWNTTFVRVGAIADGLEEDTVHEVEITVVVRSHDVNYVAPRREDQTVTVAVVDAQPEFDTSPPPILATAELEETAYAALVCFDRPAVVASMTVGQRYMCNATGIFDKTTLGFFTSPTATINSHRVPWCQWRDTRTLRVTYHSGAPARGGEAIVIKGGVIKATALAIESTSGTLALKARTPAPVLATARFSAAGSSLEVRFAGPSSRLIADAAPGGPCTMVFNEAATPGGAGSNLLSVFGAGSYCVWQSPSVLLAFLGAGATVVPNLAAHEALTAPWPPEGFDEESDEAVDAAAAAVAAASACVPGKSVSLVPSAVRSVRHSVLFATGCVPLLPPSEPQGPRAVLDAPTRVGACTDLTLRASLSEGSGGRSLTYMWSVLSRNAAANLTVDNITAAFAAEPSAQAVVKVPRDMLVPGAQFEFSVVVGHYITDIVSEASASVEVTDALLPVVVIRGGRSRNARVQRRLRLETTVAAPKCEPGESAHNTSDVGKEMSFAWAVVETRRAADVDAVVPITDIDAAVFAAGVSKTARSLTLPARTLSLGLEYEVRVTATMVAAPAVTATATVTVTTVPSGLRARIAKGSRMVGSDHPITLDARPPWTVDFDEPRWLAAGDDDSLTRLRYNWTCRCNLTDFEFALFGSDDVLLEDKSWAALNRVGQPCVNASEHSAGGGGSGAASVIDLAAFTWGDGRLVLPPAADSIFSGAPGTEWRVMFGVHVSSGDGGAANGDAAHVPYHYRESTDAVILHVVDAAVPEPYILSPPVVPVNSEQNLVLASTFSGADDDGEGGGGFVVINGTLVSVGGDAASDDSRALLWSTDGGSGEAWDNWADPAPTDAVEGDPVSPGEARVRRLAITRGINQHHKRARVLSVRAPKLGGRRVRARASTPIDSTHIADHVWVEPRGRTLAHARDGDRASRRAASDDWNANAHRHLPRMVLSADEAALLRHHDLQTRRVHEDEDDYRHHDPVCATLSHAGHGRAPLHCTAAQVSSFTHAAHRRVRRAHTTASSVRVIGDHDDSNDADAFAVAFVDQRGGAAAEAGARHGRILTAEYVPRVAAPGLFASPTDRPAVMLHRFVLAPGANYAFVVSATDADTGEQGWASITVAVNAPPSSGYVVVEPASGIMASTDFTFRALHWSDSATDLPLSYMLGYILGVEGAGGAIVVAAGDGASGSGSGDEASGDGAGDGDDGDGGGVGGDVEVASESVVAEEFMLSDFSQSPEAVSLLPAGPLPHRNHTVVLYCRDALGASMRTTRGPDGRPFVVHVAELVLEETGKVDFVANATSEDGPINTLLGEGSVTQVISLTSVVATVLDDPCATNDCNGRGQCETDKGGICDCDVGFSGPTCEVVVPQNGGWDEWSEWSGCSKSCGSGSKVRLRTCTSPEPARGGLHCNKQLADTLGPVQRQSCNTVPCTSETDGGYGAWSAWSACEIECAEGEYGLFEAIQVRSRLCDNPLPSGAGANCAGLGPSFQQQVCTAECKAPQRTCGGFGVADDGISYLCSGRGECVSEVPGEPCVADEVCNMVCRCNDGFSGQACQLTDAQRELRFGARNGLIGGLGSARGNSEISIEGQAQVATALLGVAEAVDELSTAAAAGALEFAKSIASDTGVAETSLEATTASKLLLLAAAVVQDGTLATISGAAPSPGVGADADETDTTMALGAADELVADVASELTRHDITGSDPVAVRLSSDLSVSSTKDTAAQLSRVDVPVMGVGAGQTSDGVVCDGGSGMDLPPGLLGAAPGASVVARGSVWGGGFHPHAGNGEAKRLTASMTSFELTVSEDDGSFSVLPVHNAPQPLVLTVPVAMSTLLDDFQCKTWDEAAADWTSRGLMNRGFVQCGTRRLAVCNTNHLSDFGGADEEPIFPTLSFVNPITDAGLLERYMDLDNAFPLLVLGGIMGLFLLSWVLARMFEALQGFARTRKRRQRELFVKSGTFRDLGKAAGDEGGADDPSKRKGCGGRCAWLGNEFRGTFQDLMRTEHSWINPWLITVDEALEVSRAQRITVLLAECLGGMVAAAILLGNDPGRVEAIIFTALFSAAFGLPAEIIFPHLFSFVNSYKSYTSASRWKDVHNMRLELELMIKIHGEEAITPHVLPRWVRAMTVLCGSGSESCRRNVLVPCCVGCYMCVRCRCSKQDRRHADLTIRAMDQDEMQRQEKLLKREAAKNRLGRIHKMSASEYGPGMGAEDASPAGGSTGSRRFSFGRGRNKVGVAPGADAPTVGAVSVDVSGARMHGRASGGKRRRGSLSQQLGLDVSDATARFPTSAAQAEGRRDSIDEVAADMAVAGLLESAWATSTKETAAGGGRGEGSGKGLMFGQDASTTNGHDSRRVGLKPTVDTRGGGGGGGGGGGASDDFDGLPGTHTPTGLREALHMRSPNTGIKLPPPGTGTGGFIGHTDAHAPPPGFTVTPAAAAPGPKAGAALPALRPLHAGGAPAARRSKAGLKRSTSDFAEHGAHSHLAIGIDRAVLPAIPRLSDASVKEPPPAPVVTSPKSEAGSDAGNVVNDMLLAITGGRPMSPDAAARHGVTGHMAAEMSDDSGQEEAEAPADAHMSRLASARVLNRGGSDGGATTASAVSDADAARSDAGYSHVITTDEDEDFDILERARREAAAPTPVARTASSASASDEGLPLPKVADDEVVGAAGGTAGADGASGTVVRVNSDDSANEIMEAAAVDAFAKSSPKKRMVKWRSEVDPADIPERAEWSRAIAASHMFSGTLVAAAGFIAEAVDDELTGFNAPLLSMCLGGGQFLLGFVALVAHKCKSMRLMRLCNVLALLGAFAMHVVMITDADSVFVDTTVAYGVGVALVQYVPTLSALGWVWRRNERVRGMELAVLANVHEDPEAVAAAIVMQALIRQWQAKRAMERAKEHEAYEAFAVERGFILAMVYTVVVLYILMCTYCILLFGVKYNEEQARAWLLAVLWAFLWDAGVFQPLAYGTRALLVALYTVSGCAQTELGEACNNLTYAIANVLG